MIQEEFKVTIGCMLHDIGKLLYQYNDGRSQSISGYDFVKNELGLEDEGIWEQIKYHQSDLLKTSGVDNKSLAYICYIADNIASAVDRRNLNESESRFVRNRALDSIFNILNGNDEKLKYNCENLEDNCINYPTDRNFEFDEGFYSKCFQNIKKEIKGLEYNWEHINSLLEVLEGNLSFIPSPTSLKEIADISLFDHVKMTAAFGACIYNYLSSENITDYKEELFENAEEFYKKKAFILYSMDVSGIQDFIYTISSDGALKSLRARSFYLELMMEYMTDELLAKLGFSKANLIYCGGGHAYILAPNTAEVKSKIDCFEKETNGFFLDTFSTALYVAGGKSQCSANDLKNQPAGTYGEIFKNISNEISKKKASRYSAEEILKLNSKSIGDGKRECKHCHRTDMLTDGEKCKICLALEKFSSDILNKTFFTIISENEGGNLLPMPLGRFAVADTQKELLQRIKNPKGYVRAYSKNDMFSGIQATAKMWVGDYQQGNTFENIAKASMGIERLGVLRADIDNLGQAFVKGFESKKNSDCYVTISRTATFSRKLSMFFKRHINKILSEGCYFLFDDEIERGRNAAIVYSGGDDVFVIGTWDDIIGFAIDLNKAFERFTQGTLTISAGIGIYNKNYPVSAMAKEVGELEDLSKAYPNKNAITLFDKTGTYEWNEFVNDVIKDKYVIIKEFFENSNKRGKNFLYNLLELMRNREEKINIARFAYTLSRLEPDNNEDEKQKENYKKFSHKMYEWIRDKQQCKQAITAMYIYTYSIRDKKED